MIKPKYKCIKSWTFTNSNGEEIEIFEGEKIQVVFNIETVGFDDWFIKKLSGNNVVNLEILEILQTKIKGNMVGRHDIFITFFPKDIIEITKI